MTDTEQLAESKQPVAEPQEVTIPQAPVQPETASYKVPLILSLAALGASIGLSVVSYFNWHELQKINLSQTRVEDRLDQRLAPLRSSIDTVSEGVSRQQENASKQQQQTDHRLQQLGTGQNDLAKEQSGIDRRLSVLTAIIGRSEQGWSLAEVEYLLRIANQRLLLQRDINSATEALSSADARLRELADPGYLSVRKQIAVELESLAAVPEVDLAGLSLITGNAIEQIDDLPVAGTRYKAAADPRPGTEKTGGESVKLTVSNWRELPGMLWELISGLFQIRQLDAPVRPMLSPEREYFLRENLRLQLAAARLALLREDNVQYQTALSTSRQWLREYFLSGDEHVAQLIAAIDKMAAVDIRPALPDVSASLDLLHQQMKISEQREELPVVPTASEKGAGEEIAP